MTATDELDLVLRDWFAAKAPHPAPAELADRIAERTLSVRQRPAWLVAEWWRPDGWYLPAPAVGPAFVPLLVLLLALLLALVGLYAGSRPHLPAPFGPVRNGMLVFDTGGSLSGADVTGETRPIPGFTGGTTGSSPSLSRDGTRLAYWHLDRDTEEADLYVVRIDGGVPLLVDRVSFALAPWVVAPPAVAWSPDGQRVSFAVDLGGSTSALHVVRTVAAPTGSLDDATVVDPALRPTDPAWSPTGDMIAFRGGSLTTNGVYVIAPDGSGLRRLTSVGGGDDAFAPAWSPDGRAIAFAAGDGAERSIWTVEIASGRERRIDTAPSESTPAFSPDGSRLAWVAVSMAAPDAANAQVIRTLVVEDLATGLRTGFTDIGLIRPAVAPTWSPAGDRIVVQLSEPSMGRADRLCVLDMSSRSDPLVIPAPQVSSVDWQRLAP